MGLFSIVARLTGNTTDFDRKMTRSMGKARATVGAAAARIKGSLAAAFGVGAIIALERRVIQFGSKMSQLSKWYGKSTDEVQKFAFAAEQGGTSIEAMTTAISRLARIRGDILSGVGSSQARNLLEGMGFGEKELRNILPSDLFKKVGAILGQEPGNTQKGMIAQVLMGETGGQLIKAFEQDLEATGQRLVDIGGVIDSLRIEKLNEASDAMGAMSAQMRVMGAEVAPALADTLEALVPIVSKMARVFRTAQVAIHDNAAALLMMGQDPGSSHQGNMVKLAESRIEEAAYRLRVKGFSDQTNREDAAKAARTAGLPGIPDITHETGATGGGSLGGTTGKRFNFSAGGLASIGGFVGLGGSRNAVVDIQRQQLNTLREIETNTKETNAEGTEF